MSLAEWSTVNSGNKRVPAPARSNRTASHELTDNSAPIQSSCSCPHRSLDLLFRQRLWLLSRGPFPAQSCTEINAIGDIHWEFFAISQITHQNVLSYHDLIVLSQGPALDIQGVSHNFHLFRMFLVMVLLRIMLPRSTKSPPPLCLPRGANYTITNTI